jgi:hypothetical protein
MYPNRMFFKTATNGLLQQAVQQVFFVFAEARFFFSAKTNPSAVLRNGITQPFLNSLGVAYPRKLEFEVEKIGQKTEDSQ